MLRAHHGGSELVRLGHHGGVSVDALFQVNGCSLDIVANGLSTSSMSFATGAAVFGPPGGARDLSPGEGRSLHQSRKSEKLPMAVESLTKAWARPLGGGTCRRGEPWRARRNGRALAGAPTWPSWPGGRCYVQGKPKGAPPVAFAGFYLPAAGLTPATAVESPNESPAP